MPVTACTTDGKPGFKWGDSGKCYPYTPGNEASKAAAKKKAIAQGVAIGGKLMSEEKKLAEVPSAGINHALAVCSVCGYEAYDYIEGSDPTLMPCPKCNGFMSDPYGFMLKKSTEDALALHYKPWK